MIFEINKEEGFRYIEEGDGLPIIILHGLMGGLSIDLQIMRFFWLVRAFIE